MGEEEETKKVESETTLEIKTPPQESPADEKSPKHALSSLVLIPEEKVSHSKPLPIAQKVSDHVAEKKPRDSIDRDAVISRIETEKRFALIKAWEDSEKTKAENKAYKKLSAIGARENSKKACVEAQLKKIEEKFEKKRAEYAEKMSNKTAEIHRAAEEKRAMVEAKRGECVFKVEERAEKFRASGNTPGRLFGCFSG